MQQPIDNIYLINKDCKAREHRLAHDMAPFRVIICKYFLNNMIQTNILFKIFYSEQVSLQIINQVQMLITLDNYIVIRMKLSTQIKSNEIGRS